jgi:hypothetical protein
LNQISVVGQAEGDAQLVVVYDGPRGRRGLQGEGTPGPPGRSITVLGAWNSEATYEPGDAVTARSSALAGITSLFIVRDGAAPVPGVEPRLDAPGWAEVGVYELGDAFGAVWRVHQVGHGFTALGQPACFDPQTARWGVANALEHLERAAVGLVREIRGPDEVVLQSSGELPEIDAAIVLDAETPGEWEQGRVYYLAAADGMLQRASPGLAGWLVQPLLIPTSIDSEGRQRGLMLAWGADLASEPHVGATPPPNARAGRLWYRTADKVGLYVYLDMSSGSYWVQTNG